MRTVENQTFDAERALYDCISEYLFMQQKIWETKEDMLAASHEIFALEARR